MPEILSLLRFASLGSGERVVNFLSEDHKHSLPCTCFFTADFPVVVVYKLAAALTRTYSGIQ